MSLVVLPVTSTAIQRGYKTGAYPQQADTIAIESAIRVGNKIYLNALGHGLTVPPAQGNMLFDVQFEDIFEDSPQQDSVLEAIFEGEIEGVDFVSLGQEEITELDSDRKSVV